MASLKEESESSGGFDELAGDFIFSEVAFCIFFFFLGYNFFFFFFLSSLTFGQIKSTLCFRDKEPKKLQKVNPTSYLLQNDVQKK